MPRIPKRTENTTQNQDIFESKSENRDPDINEQEAFEILTKEKIKKTLVKGGLFFVTPEEYKALSFYGDPVEIGLVRTGEKDPESKENKGFRVQVRATFNFFLEEKLGFNCTALAKEFLKTELTASPDKSFVNF